MLECILLAYIYSNIHCNGLRSLVGYSSWGRKESDMTERLHFHFQLKKEREGSRMIRKSVCLAEGMGFPGGSDGKESACLFWTPSQKAILTHHF